MSYDSYHRKIDYMRISITDRCNLRCKYCMPYDISTVSKSDLLTYEEITDICRVAVSLGIHNFKITGGEPLVRMKCANLVHMIKNIPKAEKVTLTTNGILLPKYFEDLKKAGIDGINISLDTLDAAKYKKITGSDHLKDVLEGIHLLMNSNFHVKINTVLQKDINDKEWKSLAELTKNNSIDVRFIELMPIGEAKNYIGISNKWLINEINQSYGPLIKDSTFHGNGPAVYYKIPGFQGSIGLISAIHGKFCNHCNRIRMTSTGDMKPCLCYDKHISIREAVRSHDYEKMRSILEKVIQIKPQMHHFEDEKKITEHKKMVQIGG